MDGLTRRESVLGPTTLRLYGRAQQDFLEWCQYNDIAFPASLEAVADYLSYCAHIYRPKTIVFRLSAIAYKYRYEGIPFDTKHPAIQDVVRRVRSQV